MQLLCQVLFDTRLFPEYWLVAFLRDAFLIEGYYRIAYKVFNLLEIDFE